MHEGLPILPCNSSCRNSMWEYLAKFARFSYLWKDYILSILGLFEALRSWGIRLALNRFEDGIRTMLWALNNPIQVNGTVGQYVAELVFWLSCKISFLRYITIKMERLTFSGNFHGNNLAPIAYTIVSFNLTILRNWNISSNWN